MKGTITTKDLLKIVTDLSQDNIDLVSKLVKKMSENQLNWRPNSGVWSIRQVLAHLNAYAVYYHPVFIRRIENTRFTSTKEEFISSPLGKSAWKSMKLGNAKNIKRKFKAQKGYNPMVDPELLTGDEVNQFLDHQQELIGIAEKSKAVNLKRVKIPISISKIIRLRLGDALLFVTYHNERHVQQVMNLRNHPNFPKK